MAADMATIQIQSFSCGLQQMTKGDASANDTSLSFARKIVTGARRSNEMRLGEETYTGTHVHDGYERRLSKGLIPTKKLVLPHIGWL